jgi:DNA (cytosine-5)-methyltransferase 1
LSQAGKREGLAGERSGLFLEMIRVITEMREATNGEYPKFAIWENVRGAFSSSKGEDFRCVLERFARIVEPDVSIPRPSGKNGKWAKSGAISGNGWSLAWRLFDAKYWGVAQRRQRIALVMDFGGQRASEILFERTSMSGDSCESIPAWKTFARTPEASVAGYDRMVESRNSVTGGAESEGTRRSGREGIGRVLESNHRETSTRCTEPAAYTLKIRSGCEGGGKGALVQTELSATISTLQDQTLICLVENPSLHNLKQKISPVVFESHSQDARYTQQGDTSPTCTAQWGTGGNNMPLVVEKKAFAMQRIGEYKESEHASTMKSRDYKDATDLITEKETKNLRWIVRRLTPLEDERLQGFPDGWTDIGDWIDENGKKHKTSDAARYKALGNSIALPQWYWIFQKMKPYIGENPTLGSLFDGIGGFPLVFESTYGDGTAIWGSEIDSFCVAVTKKHFPEKQRG